MEETKTATKDYTPLYTVRMFKEDDRKFIMATFLKGLYYGDSWFSKIPKAVFMDSYKRFITNVIADPSTAIHVACLNDDPDIIIGYSILGHDYNTLHWVFVKSAWRNGGVAKNLVPSRAKQVTHLTALGEKLLTKLEYATFNPFYNGEQPNV